jgi:hypothetical protein
MTNPDRLYNLLPMIYRQRDAERGYPLQGLLRVIAEQVDVLENDITQLYENWFIETCQDWVVPYIGDLIGYRIVHETGEPGDENTPQERQRNKILIPRREVANTIRYRRRKGTLALLEELAAAVAGWPARAVEFDRLVSVTQSLNHLHPLRGRTADLHDVDALELLGTPFDRSSHIVDLRGANFPTAQRSYNIGSVGVFIWRLRSYLVPRTLAYCLEEEGDECFTFSILANDIPLFNRPDPAKETTEIASELDVPTPIRRQAFEKRVVEAGAVRYEASENYYGEDRSIVIWVSGWDKVDPTKPVPREKIIPADLSDWKYRPRTGYIGVDPELGRIAFHPGDEPEEDVWVSYSYGFSGDVGGGLYQRSLNKPNAEAMTYHVGLTGEFLSIREAYEQWRRDKGLNAIIEITDNGVYEEQVSIALGENETLELRAANGTRPIIHLIDRRAGRPDAFTVNGAAGSRFCLDGIIVMGRGLEIGGDLKLLMIRHSTLVPGWELQPDCKPRRPGESSVELTNTSAYLRIERSILGRIEVIQKDAHVDPLHIQISDSIVDGIGNDAAALGAPNDGVAFAVLTILRCTVIGKVQAHAIALAENSIFTGKIFAARRQQGCIRFCYVPPGSRTPRRYQCQPDSIEKLAAERAKQENLSVQETAALGSAERLRVEPQFVSARYGKPEYCKLADTCAGEIKRGAEDESELGVFHDLFEPQREANLRVRLEEYIPAGIAAGIIFAS